MMMRAVHTVPALLGLCVIVACTTQSPPPPDRRAADEKAIRTLDSAWVKAVAAKDADGAASFYADDGELLAPASPIASGKAAIKAGWAAFMSASGFALTFAPSKIDVSGDRAYEIGTYELTTNDKSGKPQTSKAKYIVIWGRQGDGSWKALVDAPTTTQ